MIIHFDTGDGFVGQVSGRHSVCACGRSFQDNYEPDRGRLSEQWEFVTCKNCLKKRDKYKQDDPATIKEKRDGLF